MKQCDTTYLGKTKDSAICGYRANKRLKISRMYFFCVERNIVLGESVFGGGQVGADIMKGGDSG